MRSYWLDLSNPAHQILHLFRLSKRGKTELEILKQLSHGNANVYELKWKRLRDVDVHYSTVLRAFRRLEKKKLVRVVSSREVKSRGKTYALTLLGELVVALTRNGMSGAVQIIAENSQSFRECVRVHLSFDSDYSLRMVSWIIWNILHSEKGETVTRSDFDVYVRKIELEWVRKNIVNALYGPISRSEYDYLPPAYSEFDYSPFGMRAPRIIRYAYDGPFSRPMILKYLKKITHIDWIADWLVRIIEKYVEEENEWLQTLQDFKREATLAKSLMDKTR